MGLIQSVVGSVGGMLADQWKDFYTIPDNLPSTAALFAAVPHGTNAGRGSNTKGSSNIITNGSKIVVGRLRPAAHAGRQVTGFASEAGVTNGNPMTSIPSPSSWRCLVESLISRAGSASSLADSPVRSRWLSSSRSRNCRKTLRHPV